MEFLTILFVPGKFIFSAIPSFPPTPNATPEKQIASEKIFLGLFIVTTTVGNRISVYPL